MKKLSFVHIIMLLAVLPFFVIACQKDEDIKLDFDITVPADWSYLILAEDGNIYEAARKAVNESDIYREVLSIYKQSMPNYNLSTYYTLLRPLILDLDVYQSLLYESDTVINETNFKKMISREALGMIDAEQDTTYLNEITERYFFFENGYGYNMVFYSPDTAYQANKVIFNNIMSSFHYKN